MRYFAGVLFLVFAQSAAAVHCQTDDRVWRDMRVETLIIFAEVRLDAQNGRVTAQSAQPVVCRHNFPVSFPLSYKERITSTAKTFDPGLKFTAFSPVMTVGSFEYPWPLSGGRLLVEGDRTGPNYLFPLGMYFKSTSSAGKYINIGAGDLLGNFTFFKLYNFTDPSYKSFTMNAQIRASNSLDATPPVPADCTINDNRSIDVDFGAVDPESIDTNESVSSAQKTVSVKFVCDQALRAARIKLEATPSLFSAKGFATSKADIAVAMTRKSDSALIFPSAGLTYYVYLTNGVATEDFTYSLFRKPGTFPSPGAFTGSGTLVVIFP